MIGTPSIMEKRQAVKENRRGKAGRPDLDAWSGGNGEWVKKGNS
jgi:hypothetical protein